jgi:hypothetical protein
LQICRPARQDVLMNAVETLREYFTLIRYNNDSSFVRGILYTLGVCSMLTKKNKLGDYYVRFEVFTAVTMKNGVFWDATQYGSCKIRRFGGT